MSKLSGQIFDVRRLLVRLCLAFVLAGGLLLEAAPCAFADIETASDYEAPEQAEETVPVEPSVPDTADAADGADAVGTADATGGADATASTDAEGLSGAATSTNAVGAPDSATQNGAGLTAALSEPVVDQGQDEVSYTSTLTVDGIDALFGYQLRVAASAGDNVTIKNLVGGSATEPVYKEGSLYQAVMLGSEGVEASGGLAICEITVSYAADSAKAERVLTVEQIQVVTDLRTETMLVLGPNPPAATIALAPVDPLGASVPWPLVVGLVVLALVAFIVILIRRKNGPGSRPRPRPRHAYSRRLPRPT
jgi:hypothetical protein